MKISKIIQKDLRNRFLALHGTDSGDTPDKLARCSGRSTALAFRFLGQALSDPNEWTYLVDHCGSNIKGEIVYYIIKDIVKKYNISYFEANIEDDQYRIRVNTMEEIETNISVKEDTD